MKELLIKTTIYTSAVLFGVFIFIVIGGELFIQIVMLYEDVPERALIPKESALVHLGIFLYIPEILFGAIAGWYLAEQLCEKIYKY